MVRKLQELRILKAILALSKDPDSTNNVFAISDAMFGMLTKKEWGEYSALSLTYPNLRELYEARYETPLYDVEKLSGFPEHTLAHAYGAFMRRHGYSSDWYPAKEVTGPLMYFRNRMYKTHDIIHTITGFDGSPHGEIGVQAFYIGQLPETPFPSAIMASAFLRAIEQPPAERIGLLEVIHAGFEMGRNAEPVLARKWEEDWDRDTGELRQTLGIRSYSVSRQNVYSPSREQSLTHS